MSLPQNLVFLIALLVSLGILAWGVIYLLRRILSRSGSDAGNAFQRSTLLVLPAVAERNDMAKTHDCLKQWTELPEGNRISD